MHDIRFIRDDPDAFDEGLRRRGLEPLSAALIALDDRRKEAVAALQAAQERRNALSKEIGQAKAKKDEARAHELMAEVARLKDSVPALEQAEREASAALDTRLAEIPNTPNPDVPVGSDEHDNVEVRRVGTPRDGGRQHFELGEPMGLMDFETAAKLSGSRFVVLKGQLARLERALGQFMLDLHTQEHGYTEVSPPLLVRDAAMFGTAQLPKFAEDQFSATRRAIEEEIEAKIRQHYSTIREIISQRSEQMRARGSSEWDVREVLVRTLRRAEGQIPLADLGLETWDLPPLNLAELRKIDLWLIPTAEVPLTNLVREDILAEDALPLRFTALTPCFRAEAGAAGRDTRGMLRQHQFWKCELVSITTPEASGEEHARMLACAEAVLKRLELPYRVMTLCTGDMGFASAKTWDIEVWLPGQGAYREISSCSVCTDFQARRMNARYRPKEGKGPRFVHTLNGSGVAVGRALIAVMENYQNEDGSVTVPSALAPYMGGITRIEKP
jgi:seryl-tRNA synthetase